RELGPGSARGIIRRLEDLVEIAVSIQRYRPTEDAIIKERGVDLRLASRAIQLYVRAAAAEEVAASGASRVDRVLGKNHLVRKGRPTVRGLVEADLRLPRWREAAAVDRRRAMTCYVGADKDVTRVSWIDGDRSDRASRGNWTGARARRTWSR